MMAAFITPKSLFHRLVALFVSAVVVAGAHAERPDSINLPSVTGESPSFMRYSSEPAAEMESVDAGTFKSWMREPFLLKKFELKPLPSFQSSYEVSPFVASWAGGGLYAVGESQSFPGMMGIEHGSLNLTQRFGALTVTGWGEVTKYGYFRGLQTGFGFGAMVTYAISDKWSLTAFGQYATPLHPLTPAMAGFMNTPRIGGYLSYNINDRWGVSVGAQSTRSLVTNRWESRPIVTPYYRINKDVSVGVDVGGIIYSIAKDYLDRHNSPGANGAPPRPARPPMPRPNR